MSNSGREQAWDPQPGETPRSYDHFRTYLDLGPGRTIPKAADVLRIKEGTLYDLSAQFRWKTRALAYDGTMARERDEALLEDSRAVHVRRLKRAKEVDVVGRALMNMGVQPHRYEGRLPVPPADCLRFGRDYLRLAAELEDRAFGEAPESRGESVLDELLGLDGPDLRRIAEEARAEQRDNTEDNNE